MATADVLWSLPLGTKLSMELVAWVLSEYHFQFRKPLSVVISYALNSSAFFPSQELEYA